MSVHPVISAFLLSEKEKFAIAIDHPLKPALLALPAIFCVQGNDLRHRVVELSICGNTGQEKSADIKFNTKNGDVNTLIALAVKFKFGRNNETVFDETVRKGLELRAGEHITNVSADIIGSLKNTIKDRLFPRANGISFVFNKLAIYEEGGFFATHRDTPHAHNHQATLLVALPYVHTGGNLVLTAGESEVIYSTSTNGNPWCAFYTDVMHHVEPVLSGTRVVLQYDVCVENSTVNQANVRQSSPSSSDDSDSNYDSDEQSDLDSVIFDRKMSSHFQSSNCPIANLKAETIENLSLRPENIFLLQKQNF